MSISQIRRTIKRLNSNTGGQVLVLFLAVAAVLVMIIGSVYNVGIVIGEKMNLQNMADAGAYSQAVWEARSYNYFAYTNRAMIAHFCTISFATAIDSSEQLWRNFSYTIGWIPYVGQIIIQIHQFYRMADSILNPHFPEMIKKVHNPLFQETQQALFRSMWSSILYSDIADDIIRTTENMNNEPHTVQVNKIGGKRYTVTGVTRWGWPRWGIADLIGYTNAKIYSDIIDHDSWRLKFKSNFDMLKKVIASSQDYFATGSPYFPRHLMVYIPPRWTWPGGRPYPGCMQTGLQGRDEIQGNSRNNWWSWWGGGWGSNRGLGGFMQEDSFRFQIYRWKRWKLRWRGPVYTVRKHFYYDLTNFEYPHMDSLNKIDGDPARRSVYTVLTQPKTAITKKLFPALVGLNDPKKVQAISRAEVYYQNPENTSQGPTQFNAYWHARLVPVYDPSFKYTQLEKQLFTIFKTYKYTAGNWWDQNSDMQIHH